MSKLAALKKQIAALEAQAERIAKEEMSSAVIKIKGIMAEFNLTIDHLTQTVVRERAAKTTKAKTVSVARYVDSVTGKTWSGLGRPPGWIAGAKDRDVFLVGRSPAPPSAKAPATARKAAARATKVVKKAAMPAAKKTVASVKKLSKPEVASVVTKKRPAGKQAATKKAASQATASPAA